MSLKNIRGDFFIILFSILIGVFIKKIGYFLPLDFDTAIEITRMFHKEIWSHYPHHQWIIPYYQFFFQLFAFIPDLWDRFIWIFFIHYIVALYLLWKIINLFSNRLWLNWIYWISISISGMLLFLILTFEDSIITLPYYCLSFYFFILFYEEKKLFYLILSSFISGVSVSINSSDFFLVVGISLFLVMLIMQQFFLKHNLYDYIKIFFIYFSVFWVTLCFLLFLKSFISGESFFPFLYYTFVSPYEMYQNVLGEYGITWNRMVKTINTFSFLLIQDTRFLFQMHQNIMIYNILIIFIFIYSIWQVRNYKPLIIVLIVLMINFYILITSNEIAVNERFVSSIFLFLIILKSRKKWNLYILAFLLLFSLFNLKYHTLQNEQRDQILKISKYQKAYISIFYFYDEYVIQKFLKKEISRDTLIRLSSGPVLGLSHLVLENQCYIYNPYQKKLPYLPPSCKILSSLDKTQIHKESKKTNVYVDPYLLDIAKDKKWNCKDLKAFLISCNHQLKHYIPAQKNFFKEQQIQNACNIFHIGCSQKIQFSCNYLYYCQKHLPYP